MPLKLPSVGRKKIVAQPMALDSGPAHPGSCRRIESRLICIPAPGEEREAKYAIHLPANDHLERKVAQLLTRPLGRPSYKPVVRYKSFLYQAASWKRARRVVAKVEFRFGELFPRVGFIVTNFQTSSRAVVRFYNKRGTAEQWIKVGKQAVAMTRLSCHRFRANQVQLWLSVIAYNLGNLWRRLALRTGVANWSLTSLQQRLVKTAVPSD